MAFQKGDSVVLHDKHSDYDGEVGEVTQVAETMFGDENCSFFVSLSKQAAFNSEVRLGDGLTLRGKVEAYPAKKSGAIDAVASEFGWS